MKFKVTLVAILTLICFSCTRVEKGVMNVGAEQLSIVDYVNPLMGTDSKYTLSNGNTYPAISTPWGMNFWTPEAQSFHNKRENI